MANDEKKFVEIGVSNLKFSLLNEDGLKVGESLKVPGTTEADISISAENATITADNGPYMNLSSGISKITLKLSNYFLGPEVTQMLLGTKYAKGMEFYGSDTMPNHVAVEFQTDLQSNETHPLYVGLLNGIFKFPDDKHKTKGSGAPDPATKDLEGEFILQPRGNTKTALVKGFTSDPEFDLATFENYVMPKSQEDLDAAIKAVADALKQPATPAVSTPGK